MMMPTCQVPSLSSHPSISEGVLDYVESPESPVELNQQPAETPTMPSPTGWFKAEYDPPLPIVAHFLNQVISASLDMGQFWLWIFFLTLQRILWTWMILLYLHIIFHSIYILWSRIFPPPAPAEDANNNHHNGGPNGFVRYAQFIAL